MASIGKIFIGTAIGAGLIKLFSYAISLKRTASQLQSVVTGFKLSGLTAKVDVQLKNPSSNTLKIKFPFIQISVKDTVVGTSKAVDQDITIPKNGEAKISGILVTVPATGLLSLGKGVLNILTKQNATEIKVQTITTIDLGWTKLPYSKTDTFNLKPKAK